MPYRQGWYIEQRILVCYIWGTLTLHDLNIMWTAGAHLLDAGTSPVHIIAFDSEIEHAPRNLQTLRDMSGKIGQHPHVGWVINIGYQNPFASFVSGVLAKLFGVPYRRFATFDEAVAFLRINDLTIDWANVQPQILDDLTARQ